MTASVPHFCSVNGSYAHSLSPFQHHLIVKWHGMGNRIAKYIKLPAGPFIDLPAPLTGSGCSLCQLPRHPWPTGHMIPVAVKPGRSRPPACDSYSNIANFGKVTCSGGTLKPFLINTLQRYGEIPYHTNCLYRRRCSVDVWWKNCTGFFRCNHTFFWSRRKGKWRKPAPQGTLIWG